MAENEVDIKAARSRIAELNAAAALEDVAKRFREREDVSTLEIALVMSDVSREEAMRAFGRSRDWVKDQLRLLTFPEDVRLLFGPDYGQAQRLRASDVVDVYRQETAERQRAMAHDLFRARNSSTGTTLWAGSGRKTAATREAVRGARPAKSLKFNAGVRLGKRPRTPS